MTQLSGFCKIGLPPVKRVRLKPSTRVCRGRYLEKKASPFHVARTFRSVGEYYACRCRCAPSPFVGLMRKRRLPQGRGLEPRSHTCIAGKSHLQPEFWSCVGLILCQALAGPSPSVSSAPASNAVEHSSAARDTDRRSRRPWQVSLPRMCAGSHTLRQNSVASAVPILALWHSPCVVQLIRPRGTLYAMAHEGEPSSNLLCRSNVSLPADTQTCSVFT